MKSTSYLLFLLLAGALQLSAFGQDSPPIGKWALQLNLQHQDFLLPGAIYVGQLGVIHEVRVRPVFALDGQRFFFKNPKNKGFFSGQIAYHNNLYQNRWWSGKFGLGYERLFRFGLITSIRIEAGWARVKDSDPQYVFEEGKWVYLKTDGKAFTTTQLSPRLDIGYRIGTIDHPIDLFANGQLTALAHPEWGLLPYYGVGVGLRYGL